MMKILKVIFIILCIIVLAILIAALFIKKEYGVTRSVVINKPLKEVFNYVKMLKNQNAYSKWGGMDRNMEKIYTGTDGTVGFISGWKSKNKNVGTGEQEIIGLIDGSRIDYDLRFKEPFESNAKTFMITETLGENQTKVTWGFSGKMKYPFNFFLLIMNMEKMLGDDFQTGLNNLKLILEK
jgi:hypothetical protein